MAALFVVVAGVGLIVDIVVVVGAAVSVLDLLVVVGVVAAVTVVVAIVVVVIVVERRPVSRAAGPAAPESGSPFLLRVNSIL